MKLLIAKQNEQIVEQNERITKLESQLNLLVEGKRSAIQEEELMRKKMEQLVGQKVVEMTNDAWGLRREFEKKASGMEKKMDEHVEYQRESVDLMWKQFRIFVAASISDAIPAANVRSISFLFRDYRLTSIRRPTSLRQRGRRLRTSFTLS